MDYGPAAEKYEPSIDFGTFRICYETYKWKSLRKEVLQDVPDRTINGFHLRYASTTEVQHDPPHFKIDWIFYRNRIMGQTAQIARAAQEYNFPILLELALETLL